MAGQIAGQQPNECAVGVEQIDERTVIDHVFVVAELPHPVIDVKFVGRGTDLLRRADQSDKARIEILDVFTDDLPPYRVRDPP